MCIVKYVPGHKRCHCQVHLHRALPVQCVQVGMCMCVFGSLTVKRGGCGGKGGAITLGLQMGFPPEDHAPVFSKK